MHRAFRKLLEQATGASEYIIAVNLDIRGFSPFSKRVESPDTATFIKRVYMDLIDNYFQNASFYKPTGDGLLITIPYNDQNLEDVARETIGSCLVVIENFSTFCEKDPMINFEVPRKVGIGISRGTACRLTSNEETLDYSGRVLNLASRLMDLARPEGIVFDDGFKIGLLTDEQMKLFKKEKVYIKGIAESKPIHIFYTKDFTDIPSLFKRPVKEIQWNAIEETLTLSQIKQTRIKYGFELKTKPLSLNEIFVEIIHPSIIRGRKHRTLQNSFSFAGFEYLLKAGKNVVIVDFAFLATMLEAKGVKDNHKVTIKIIHPEK